MAQEEKQILEMIANRKILLQHTVNNSFVIQAEAELPTFNGNYEEWLQFKDNFTALIHSKATFSNIHKLMYLRQALSENAASVIAGLSLSSDNYCVAWNLLHERYHQPKLLLHYHLKGLFEMPSAREESYSFLQLLANSTLKHTGALKSLNEPVDKWDTILVHLVSTKLDPTTLRDWVSQNLAKDTLPTLTEMIIFLLLRCDALKAAERDLCLSKSAIFCHFCRNQHKLFTCEEFLDLDAYQRFQEVKRLNLCVNCLSNTHQTVECRGKRCKKCRKRHNTLLHR